MAVINERLEAARRYKRWKGVLARIKTESKSKRAESDMETNRLRFSGLRELDIGPGTYLESIVEGNDLMPVRYFEMGKLATKPVGRIHFDLGPRVGQGYATGFLVGPSLLLTNHHVLPTQSVAQAATVTFDAEDGVDGLPRTPHVFRLLPQQLYLADPGLDYCFVAVAPISSQASRLADFGYLILHQGTGKILRDEYATIVQHPRGRQKHVAVRNNAIVVYVYDNELDEAEAAENNHIYYSTDTLPGSSGAPVFSDQWYVVALHRRGVPKIRQNAKGEPFVVRHNNSKAQPEDSDELIKFDANEGVRISRILRHVESFAVGDADKSQDARNVLRIVNETRRGRDVGPFWLPTESVHQTSARLLDGADDADFLEVTRRPPSTFADVNGFDPLFLGVNVGLPELGADLKKAAARRKDKPAEYLLPFRHFTTVVHAQRRLPIFAAVNINGERLNTSKKPARPAWSYDPRIDEAQQPDDSIFSSMVQRGHMAAREFMWWGDDDEAKEADIHSFTLTNVCPQMGKFNGSLEWYKLERLLMGAAKSRKQRVNCFMGPIFSADDPLYDDLRGENSKAIFGTGIRMPLKFWYLLVWKDGTNLKHRGLILDQSDDIERAGPLEFDFEAPATIVEATLADIKKATQLTFPGLG